MIICNNALKKEICVFFQRAVTLSLKRVVDYSMTYPSIWYCNAIVKASFANSITSSSMWYSNPMASS